MNTKLIISALAIFTFGCTSDAQSPSQDFNTIKYQLEVGEDRVDSIVDYYEIRYSWDTLELNNVSDYNGILREEKQIVTMPTFLDIIESMEGTGTKLLLLDCGNENRVRLILKMSDRKHVDKIIKNLNDGGVLMEFIIVLKVDRITEGEVYLDQQLVWNESGQTDMMNVKKRFIGYGAVLDVINRDKPLPNYIESGN